MNCPACAHQNRPGAKFCEECGAVFKRLCASCSAELRPSAKFCDECGTPIAAPAAARAAEVSGARKVVTIVFADLVGSTALHERLDPESARRFMEGYYAAMRGAVEAHGGSVTQFLGDGVKAVFGIPRVAEDDAIRAVRAAVAMQSAFRALTDPQRAAVGRTGLRVAVNTGEVVASDASEIIGDPVNVAARLQEQGRDGDVLIGEATERLVSRFVTLELLGSFALKGRTEAVSAYRVTSLERPVAAAAAAFVGRDDELTRISSVYDTVVEKPATALAVLVGSPGLGKSRLIEEFAGRLGDGAAVIHAHCDAAGGASFAPLAEALRALPELDAVVPGGEAERARILDGVRALVAGSPASPEETFFVVRRLLAALAASRPVVLVIDDLHWAEPLLLDLIEHLVQWGSGVPLLVLVGARPELREVRSTLVTPGGLVSDVVTLSGLDAGAAMRLAASVIGAADLPASVAAKVLATSEGNPLFVGELVRMLVYEGALKRDGNRWTAGTELAALEMPPTIHALLAARIERLRPEERIVLERAAVIGRSFSRSAVAELLSQDVTDLDARLESLRRAELVERDTGWFLGEPLLRFHHVLIRDAAYRRILKGTRAELHARFADWVEARASDSIEHDETIGWHLEQAHQHLRELGPIDVRGRALGERAAKRLAAAGRRALARDDVPLASGLLGRALDRLDRDDAARAELALEWCEALLAAGDVAPATAALEELDRFAASDARLRAWHTCFVGQLKVLTAPSGLSEAAESVAAASRELAELGDVAGEAKAHFVHAQAFARMGKIAACEAALDRALAAARRAGDRRRANTVLAIAPLAALWGPSPVTRASGRCLDVVRVLRITQGAPAVEAVALSCQGVLEALRGRGDAARRMVASARKMLEELGITQRLLESNVFAARIDLLDGNAASAERGLRAAYEGMRELGLGIDAARAAALLARALLALDRAAEAEALTRESERLAGDDLQAAIAWRGARAEALARRGETVDAVALASKAVEIAAATDALLDHADARLALAAALRAAGRDAEADSEEGRATELWVAKGATLLAERARRESSRPPEVAAPREVRVEARPARRRIPANRATAAGERLDVAIAARDAAALEQLFCDPCVVVHHATGVTYGRREQLATWKSIFRAEHLRYRREALATLGDSLELWRHWISLAGLSDNYAASFGHSDFEEIVVGEADGHGGYRRFEIFATDQLGHAIARLYEHHAELLPDGPERASAEVTARAVAFLLTPLVLPDPMATVFAPTYEDIDHRSVGYGALSRSQAANWLGSLHEVAADWRYRVDDVLALSPSAIARQTTSSGVWRDGGGTFERTVCTISVFDAQGRVGRNETFDGDREAEALARFDALVAAVEPKLAPRRRVRANAANATTERFAAAFAARQVAEVEALFADSLRVVDHLTGTTYGRQELFGAIRRMMSVADTHWIHAPLAVLGERLSLGRRSISGSASRSGRCDVAAYEVEGVTLNEVDAQGRYQRLEFFAVDNLGDASVRLYERYAELLPEGPERTRAAAAARTWALIQSAASDLARVAEILAPDLLSVDHRRLSTWSGRGAEAYLAHRRALHQVADDVEFNMREVLAIAPGARLTRTMHSGTDRLGGGVYERPFLVLFATDAEGRLARAEWFDADREAEALARFDELIGSSELAPAPEPFDNDAARADRTLLRCFNARDWDGVLALAAPELVFDERRRMLRNTCGREVWLEQFRMMFDVPSSRFATKLLATRGERLALSSHCFEGEVADGGGPLAMDDHFALHEVDREGRIVAIVLFDQSDLEAAHDELDARFEAGEDDSHAASLIVMREFARAVASREWSRMLALCSPALIEQDHRPLAVLGTTRGAEAWVQNFRTLAELAPDSRYRVDHFRARARGFCSVGTWVGTREGGPYEIPLVAVIELDAQDRIARADVYDADQLDRARARFDALAGPEAVVPSASPFANVASRLIERAAMRLWAARDWAGIVAAISPAMRMDDRRRLMRLEIGYDDFLAQFRMIFDQPASRWRTRLLATRGERLSLHRTMFEADVSSGGGPLAVDEHLSLSEVDADGRWIASVTFDLDDVDAAYAELDARFEAGEGAEHPRTLAALPDSRRARYERDADIFAAGFARELVCHDHRMLGWGTLHGAAAFVDAQQTLLELAPDARWRNDHVAILPRGHFIASLISGTRDGGAFELEFLRVSEIDAQGKICRIDIYDPDQRDQARARYDELAMATRELARFENAATRQVERATAAQAARDWQSFGSFFAPGFRNYDRRAMVQLETDREQFLASYRQMIEMTSAPLELDVLATRGDRLAVVRLRWQGADGDIGPTEIDSLLVAEVDPRGDGIAGVTFDPGDIDAAYAELDARFEAGEASAHPRAVASLRNSRRALAARDWDAHAALFAHDLVCHDHRVLGWGTLHGVAEFERTQQVLIELAPDTRWRNDHIATSERGHFQASLRFGTRDGGAFELEVLRVSELDAQGRICRIDIYDPDRVDEALARFAELRAHNLAAETMLTRWQGAFAAGAAGGDWESLQELCTRDMVFEDRRRLALLTGDRDLMVASARERYAMGAHPVQRVFETFGDRVVLLRMLWAGGASGGRFEIEYFVVVEVDVQGYIRAVVLLDADDLPAARAEALHRQTAIDAASQRPDPLRVPENAASRGLARRLRVHGDVAALRTFLADDLSFEDRGRRALVRGGVEEWLNSVRFLVDEAGGRSQDELVATAGDRLALHRVVWREAPGAPSFELTRYRATEVDAAGKLCWVVLVDGEQRAEAHAALFERYVAQGADGMPRGLVDCLSGVNLKDLVRVRSGLCDDLVIDDRRRAGLPRIEGADAYVASLLAAHELSPDLRLDVLYFAAVRRDGCVFVARASGTSMGGGAFESFYGALARFRDDKIARFEFFELEQLDTALERFEAMRPDPRPIPPNTATRLSDRAARAIAAADRSALRACASRDFRFEDRGRRALVSGDAETWLDSVLFLGSEQRARLQPELLGTLGDRIAVYRDAWNGTTEGGGFELGGIRVFEADEQGQLRALLLFDIEDRAAAFTEALHRFVAGEAAGSSALQAFVVIFDALNARDWRALREGLTSDLVVIDQRQIGLGVFDREGWMRALQVGVELSEGLTFEIVSVVAWNERGGVLGLHRYGSIPDGGGPFETYSIAVVASRDNGVAHYELFDEADAERALARFEELSSPHS